MSRERSKAKLAPVPKHARYRPDSREVGAKQAPWLLVALASAFAIVAALWPVRHNQFINLDDQVYITGNPHVLGGLQPENIRWAFTNLEAGFWHPLTWLSLQLDCQLFGTAAGYHHLSSLFYHTLATMVLFAALRKFGLSAGVCFFCAALFGIHPMHVEPVAWAADRKDVLCALFWTVAMFSYSCYAGLTTTPKRFGSKALWYGLCLFSFACALMSKSMAMTFPAILLVLDWWPLGRFKTSPATTRFLTVRRLVVEKFPFACLSLLSALLTLRAESNVGAVGAIAAFPLQFRFANALVSSVGYLLQMLWPRHLAIFYPYPQSFSIVYVVGAALVLATITIACWRWRNSFPALLAGWSWYLISLSPVIGLLQVGGHASADRYVYLPSIGIFLGAAVTLSQLTKRLPSGSSLMKAFGIVVLTAYAIVARAQVQTWRTTQTVFEHALESTKNNYLAHYCLGLDQSSKGDSAAALSNFQAAVRLNPWHAESHDALGVELASAGHLEEAATMFQKATQLNPKLAAAHGNLALCLASLGKWQEALPEYEFALRLAPTDARVHNNYANLLADHNQQNAALTHYAEAIRLSPENAEFEFNLGVTLAAMGQRADAAQHLRRALDLRPDYEAARKALSGL